MKTRLFPKGAVGYCLLPRETPEPHLPSAQLYPVHLNTRPDSAQCKVIGHTLPGLQLPEARAHIWVQLK